MQNDIHIVSLIVQVKPEYKDDFIKKASALPDSEYYTDEGVCNVVLVLELDSESELLCIIDEINSWQGVISTQLCYHHCESKDSLQEEIHYANNPA